MVLDHYQIRNSHREPYSVHACNRLLRTSREFGVEEAEFLRVLNSLHLSYRRITFEVIEPELRLNHPILCLYLDEDQEGHYALMVGFDHRNFIFNDPWHKRRITWPKEEFRGCLEPFGQWLLAVLGPKNP